MPSAFSKFAVRNSDVGSLDLIELGSGPLFVETDPLDPPLEPPLATVAVWLWMLLETAFDTATAPIRAAIHTTTAIRSRIAATR